MTWSSGNLLLAVVLLASSSWAQCQPYWCAPQQPPFVSATGAIAYNDGTGPAVYSTWEQPTGVSHVLRWRDGSVSYLEAGLPAASASVAYYPMQLLDDGTGVRPCIVASDPTGRRFMARWEGDRWHEVWPGMYDPGEGNSTWTYPVLSGDVGEGVHIYGLSGVGGSPSAIVRWDGWGWVAIGPGGEQDGGPDLFLHDDGTGLALYAYTLARIHGVPTIVLARYRAGAGWTTSVVQHPGSPRRFISFNDGTGPGIYAVGWFSTVNPDLQGVYKWNGSGFDPVGESDSTFQPVYDGAVFDDGSGPALYVAGAFTALSGVPLSGIGRWDGHGWSPLGAGSGGRIIVPVGDRRGPSLMVFATSYAGGAAVSYVAEWVGCPNCYANCDLSTAAPVLNVNDFVCFLQKFAARDPYANCDVNDTIDVNDFVCFLQRFAAGCP